MVTKKQYKYALPIGYELKGGENDYVIEEVLGKGGFGITYKVKTTAFVGKIPFNVNFAVKEYFPDICSREADNATIKIPETKHDEVADGIRDFLNEGRKLQAVCDLNPNIVNVNEVFQSNGTAYYVLEYLEGGDLRKMVKNNGSALTERQMLDVMVPIGHAMQCLHNNNILHLDLKPDNIVMRRNSDGDEEPVLIDFGIAVHFRSDGTPTSKSPSQGLSSGYSPIEQYQLIKKFDPRLDVYSFCATCFYLLTGKDPIEAFDMTPELLGNAIPAEVSGNVVKAIKHGMAMNKNSRTASINNVLSEFDTKDEEITVVNPEKPLQKTENSDTVNIKARNEALKSAQEIKLEERSNTQAQDLNGYHNNDNVVIRKHYNSNIKADSQFRQKDNGNWKQKGKKILIYCIITASLILLVYYIYLTNFKIEDDWNSPSYITSSKSRVEYEKEKSPHDITYNLSQEQIQWNHGLAIGAQWIAIDLGFGETESDLIKRYGESYTLDELNDIYGSRERWVEYYDKLKAHEGETGDVDKLVSTVTDVYKKTVIKVPVKRNFEKFLSEH